MKGADWFVDGASSLASIFHVSQLVIGLTICAMGTSLPEAAVSLVAGLKGNSGITIGNVVGSNILNILIVLGMSALITKIKIENQHCSLKFLICCFQVLFYLLWEKSTSCIISRRTYFNRYVYHLFTLFVLAVTKRK